MNSTKNVDMETDRTSPIYKYFFPFFSEATKREMAVCIPLADMARQRPNTGKIS